MKKILFALCLVPAVTFAAGPLNKWKETIINDAEVKFAKVSMSVFKKPLQITVLKEASVVASAHHHNDRLELVINQGLLDSPRLTADVLRMTLCHELGHLFGGAPRRNVPPEWEGPTASDGLSYHSAEGQSDYYASAICFRQLINTDAGEKTDIKRAGPKLIARCDQAHPLKKERELCLRTALAGQDFLNLVFEFPISTEANDSSVTPTLIRDTYPSRQCRLDTIVNGALCSDTFSDAFDFMQMEKNDCTFSEAKRPPCWYHQ